MRIAILSWQYIPEHVGGTEIVTQNIARQLALRGHEVLIITTRDTGLPLQRDEEGVSVCRIRTLRPKWIKYLWFCLNVILLVQRYKPDIVHAQAIWTGLPALFCKVILGRPYVLWTQGSDVYYPRLFKGFISKLIQCKANTAIALTTDLRREMQVMCKRNVLVIPNGVNLDRFNGHSQIASRHKLGIGMDARVIIFVGSMIHVKGVRFLVESMPKVLAICPNALLILVGDGIEEKNLRDDVVKLGISRQVTFAGRVKHDDVPDYLAASDVFILPSLSEGFPLVILEAMAVGLPVICTNVRGMATIVVDGVNGFLVQPENSDHISSSILRILGDETLRCKMSEANLGKVASYSWENVASQLDSVYLKSCAGQGTHS